MRALILAAGRGRRMKNLTSDRPKGLLSVNGRPLIEWSLDALREASASQIGVVTGYRDDLMTKVPADLFFHNPEWETTNMVYSLFQAREWLREGDTLLCYSDILFTTKTIQQLNAGKGDIVIANNVNWLTTWKKRFANPLEDAETFKLSADGTLTEIGKRPSAMDEIQGQYMGLIKVTPVGWKAFEDLVDAMKPHDFKRIDMTSTLNQLIGAGNKLYTVNIEEDWFEFDSEEDLSAYV